MKQFQWTKWPKRETGDARSPREGEEGKSMAAPAADSGILSPILCSMLEGAEKETAQEMCFS